ncbi:hypothetical protein [Streptomyces sp. NPDC051776]|uniref:hypothetical protein n=1 Tax=Streptomyces sp. NPDC051776 TaxID=3155414 RepID=UPI00342CBCF9
MIVFGVFLTVMTAVFLAAGLADQQKLWWRFQARRFRHPEAHEPSESGYRGSGSPFCGRLRWRRWAR